MPLFSYYTETDHDQQIDTEKSILRYSFFVSLLEITAIWLGFLAQFVFGGDFWELGIYPLKIRSLPGIITSPFIHANLKHIFANTVPLFLLSFSLFFFYRKISLTIYLVIYLTSGICVWLLGRESWHIGASGIVYGLASFLIISGIIRNDIRLLTISLIVIMVYGGIFWGIFPLDEQVSWESHLWGTISGVVCAVVFRKYGPPQKKWHWQDEDDAADLNIAEEEQINDAPADSDDSFRRPE